MNKYYKNEKYTVIIGDIIDSKIITNRKEVQRKFKNILNEVNSKYREDIASKFSITLGDEFQGLLKSKKNIINIVSKIEIAMWPVKLRFGIGIGDISTQLDYDNTAEIDGTAYHRARAMINLLEKEESQYSKRVSSILICSSDSNVQVDSILNSIFSTTKAIKSKWTLRQTEIIHEYLLNEENQYQTAERLEIGQSTVSRALSSANFITYKSALDNVNSFLALLDDEND